MHALTRHMNAEGPAWKFDGYSAAFILLLLLLGWRVTSGLELHMDILLWDEANYLSRGLWMFERIPRVWGPSYSAWYKLLSYIESDKIALYYLNFRIMTIGTSLVAFILLCVCGIRPWIAFLLSAGLLLSSFNLPVWPKVSHYCILLVMLSVILSRYASDMLAKWCLFTLGLLVAGYARPELFLSFSLSFVITVTLGIWRWRKTARPGQAFFLFTILWSLLICWFYKTPFNSGDSGRSIKVFYQHFSMNYIQWHHLDLNWWLDWPEIISKNFKHPEKLSTILQFDGPLFWKHIFSNIRNFIAGLGSLTGQFFIPFTVKPILPVAFGILSVLLYFLPVRFSGLGGQIRAGLHHNTLTLLFLLIFILPGFIVCIYAYPRTHYLVIYLPFLLLLAGIVLDSLTDPGTNIRSILALLLGMGICWAAPGPGDFDFYQLERKEKSMANVNTLKYLQSLQPKDTLRIFDLEGDLSSMLSGKYRGYINDFFQRKSVSVSEFIDLNQIDVVYVTPTLKKYPAVIRDSAFQRLLTDPAERRFYPEKTGNFTPYLLIREKL